MCGRARLATDYSELKIRFWVPPFWPAPNIPARWNAAPTQDMPIVRFDPELGHRRLDGMRWGLVPHWAKDVKIGYSTFNARAEAIETKPAFRDAYMRRRCLVPLDGFYEWQALAPKHKQPYSIQRADGEPMGIAGLWETWKSPEGETIRSFTIITVAAGADFTWLHSRMPVILEPADWPVWLGEQASDREAIGGLLRPCPADRLTTWPVSARVGNVRNEGPDLAVPINL